ncbi:hypothetical protein AC579_5284 [Pseudocercospora musae]|uniref:Uncharacterized protein n=1 Tax=Pseudocercospora musae TaxID=113226 RepID=A0A139IQ51_9PEZI|nr:hypothetical protein AC579_5284 [Pseudocercospora musae]
MHTWLTATTTVAAAVSTPDGPRQAQPATHASLAACCIKMTPRHIIQDRSPEEPGCTTAGSRDEATARVNQHAGQSRNSSYGYGAIEANGGLIKFAPNHRPGDQEWEPAAQNESVGQDRQGQLCQIVNGKRLNSSINSRRCFGRSIVASGWFFQWQELGNPHGSPQDMRVTAGGRIVPSDQSPAPSTMSSASLLSTADGSEPATKGRKGGSKQRHNTKMSSEESNGMKECTWETIGKGKSRSNASQEVSVFDDARL